MIAVSRVRRLWVGFSRSAHRENLSPMPIFTPFGEADRTESMNVMSHQICPENLQKRPNCVEAMESVEIQQASRLMLDCPPEFTLRIHCTEIRTGRFIDRISFLTQWSCMLTPVSWDRAFVNRTHARGFGPLGLQSLSRGWVFALTVLSVRHRVRTRRRLLSPLPRQRLRFGDLGRCHPWRLLRQGVSNGLAYGSEFEGLLKRLMRTQPLGRL